MSPMPNEPEPVTKEDAEVDLIIRAYAREGREVKRGRGWWPEDDQYDEPLDKQPDKPEEKPQHEHEDWDFLYEEGVILVRDTYLLRVREILGRALPVREGFIDGLTVLSLENAEHSRFPDVISAVSEIDKRLGPGIATPNHIFWVTPVHCCPATEPVEVPLHALPDPGICDGGGEGVLVYVSDTGLLPEASEHPWLAGVTGTPDELEPTSDGTFLIPEYAGHGTFIAGVARCMAPASAVYVARDFRVAGTVSETQLVRRLNDALRRGADVISVSAGGFTRRHLPPLSFEYFWNRFRHYKGVALVAAAGNNSQRKPFWPAAFPQVVGVGALAANGRARAYFSDFGPWVDVYAPGEDLVNAFAKGTYVCREPPDAGHVRHFRGMARWSGTSFSTPLVAGLIAARMSRTGENGRQAADALLARARQQALPGVGPVLYPCDTGDVCRCKTEDPCEHRHCRCGRC